MGVGRSNNYVELFHAGSAINSKLGQQMWTPIIPNSQLIVFGEGESNWALELFISPTQQLFLIVISCAICLFLIGIAILVLHCQEKQEDRKKREQHFDFF
jgi:hypothetical protein